MCECQGVREGESDLWALPGDQVGGEDTGLRAEACTFGMLAEQEDPGWNLRAVRGGAGVRSGQTQRRRSDSEDLTEEHASHHRAGLAPRGSQRA